MRDRAYGPNGFARECERLRFFSKERVLSKRDLSAFKGTSVLGSGVESPLIFHTKRKKW